MTKHAHAYIIEEQHGPTSLGRCKTCGAERVFRNAYIGDQESESSHRYRKTKSGKGLVLR